MNPTRNSHLPTTPTSGRSGRALRPVAAAAMALTVLAACGSSGSSTSQVASLGTLAGEAADGAGGATGDTVDPADTQEAVLAYAACMRENGVEMADPTFDADGNMQGGLGFGPDSGIDPQATEFQTAQEACGDLIDGIALGRGPGGGLDRDAVQTAMADYTDCLRGEGLDVDDVSFGPPAGAVGADGDGATGGSIPGIALGQPIDGSVPTGGFQGGPPPDGAGGGPGGAGFDPTSRLVEQLGLDADDPTVAAALESCQSILESAFQPATSTTEG